MIRNVVRGEGIEMEDMMRRNMIARELKNGVCLATSDRVES